MKKNFTRKQLLGSSERETGASCFVFCIISAPSFPVCCRYNESHDATKINEPVGVLLCPTISKSWNNKISTKSQCTIQIQEQTKPKQNKAGIFEERRTQTAVVPFNNIQSAVFSVPVCYSECSSKYLERRRGDETSVEQWDLGCVMASVLLAPPTLCSLCPCPQLVPCLFSVQVGSRCLPPPPHVCLADAHLPHKPHTHMRVHTRLVTRLKRVYLALEYFNCVQN